MKGKLIYLSIGSVLGLIWALENNGLFFILFVSLIVVLRKYKRFTGKSLMLLVGVFLLFFLKGELDGLVNKTAWTGKEKNFTVKISEPIKIDGDSFSSYAKDKITGERIVIQYRMPTMDEKKMLQSLSIGSVCRIKGELVEPSPSRNENAFNYKEFLRHEHVFWILKAETLNVRECVQTRDLITLIQSIRQQGIAYINDNFPENTAPLATALIFGDRELIDSDILGAYQRLGVVHLLAISGLHVGLLTGIIYYLGLRLQMTREKVTNFLIAFLPGYIILTGASPSVIRACVMMLVVLLYSKFNHHTRLIPIDLISIVFLMYVFFEPHIVYNIGFQLSFSVTFALLLSAPILSKYTLRPLSLLMCTSFIAQLSSIPVLLYHFFEFSLIGIVVNVFYVPLFSIIILPVLLFIFLAHLLIANGILPLSLLDYFIYIVNALTEMLSGLPFSAITIGRPSAFMMLIYGITIPFFFYKWEQIKVNNRFILVLILPVSVIIFHMINVQLHSEGEVTVIDVGQGDSILIRLPFSRGTYLIDTGGTIQFQNEAWKERRDPFEVGEDVLVPYLKSKGITKLDKLILTHGDMDHVGGADALLETIAVKEIVLPKIKNPSELEKNIIKIGREKQIPIHYASKGDSWIAGGNLKFSVLSPPSSSMTDRNDQSIVLYADLGGLTWLFTGDLESEGEERLMSSFPALKVNVLKVGHHGSNSSTSDAFLDFLKPEVAIISAGVNNRFGHPHDDVINRLIERRTTIYRTDEDGAVSFYFKENGGTFSTWIHRIK